MAEVEIADYNPRWPRMFEVERGRLLAALAELDGIERIEHVGSTAVPGLAAKPVIDLMIGLSDTNLLDITSEATFNPSADFPITPAGYRQHVRFVNAISRLGYTYRGEHEIPGRLFFRKDAGGVRTHHIHAVQFDGDFWRNHLRFRDMLRENQFIRAQYEQLKRDLAAQHPNDRTAYTAGKTNFVLATLQLSAKWKKA